MTTPSESQKPRVFVNADALFAGATSPSENSASLVLLRMAEITLIDALASQQVVSECERNLLAKLPQALPAFHLLVQRCLRVVPDPLPQDLVEHKGRAHPEDLSVLICAVREACPWLVTFNLKDFKPGHPRATVLRPGDFVMEVRTLLGGMR